MTYPKGYQKRYLHERSFLSFEFPGPNEVSRAYIPFLENAEVSESQKSNLAEYSLLARPGSIYSYLGAKSRNISLQFNITLQHVIDTLGTEGINERFKQIFVRNDKSDEQRRFFPGRAESSKDIASTNGINHAVAHMDYYNSLTGGAQRGLYSRQQQKLQQPNGVFNSLQTIPGFETLALLAEYDFQSFIEKQKALNLVMWWVNLARSSVLNNSKNTIYGAPIVRLTHGPLYNNIPCLAENVNIQIDNNVGFDVESLLPKRITISMSLVEQRIGDFGEFSSEYLVKGDNITGWESVISENNMDPYNGLITQTNGLQAGMVYPTADGDAVRGGRF